MSNNQQQQQKKNNAIGIKRSAFEGAFADQHGFAMTFGKPAEGNQPNRVGARHHCTLQLIGPADNLVSAGLIIYLPFLDQIALVRARRYLETFFQLVPDAANGPTWVWDNLVEAASKTAGVETFHQGLKISLNCLPTNDGVAATLTITKA